MKWHAGTQEGVSCALIERVKATGISLVPIWRPEPPFVFGGIAAFAIDQPTADRIVKAMRLLESIEEAIQ